RRTDQRGRRAPGLPPRPGQSPCPVDLSNAPRDLPHRPGPPHQYFGSGRRLRGGPDREDRTGASVLCSRRESVGEDLGQARMTSPVAGGEPVRVLPLDAGAGPDPSTLGLKEEELRELYRLMGLTRKADLEATALQRQGELAVYPPLIGQEAAQVGSAFALEESDWIFPSYRELG